jgi:hypothetical protein
MEFASSLKRCAFSITVVALAGCGGSQSQSMTQMPEVPTAELGQSWMLPGSGPTAVGFFRHRATVI